MIERLAAICGLSPVIIAGFVCWLLNRRARRLGYLLNKGEVRTAAELEAVRRTLESGMRVRRWGHLTCAISIGFAALGAVAEAVLGWRVDWGIFTCIAALSGLIDIKFRRLTETLSTLEIADPAHREQYVRWLASPTKASSLPPVAGLDGAPDGSISIVSAPSEGELSIAETADGRLSAPKD